MLRSLIAFCLSRRLLVMVAFAAFLGLGFVAFLTLNIEAYPDPAPPIIEIIAQQQGQSPEEVERYITIPIEVAVASTPGLKFIRSNTVYGLGFIRLQFEYGRDYHFVRQQTLNRLKDAVLPAGVLPVISPAGGISEIFRYELTGPPGMDVMRLKALQDWVVERKLRIVPGIADVAVLGGKTKEFQAEINLDRMMAYGLTLPQIMTAISASNSNVGGRTIAIGEQSVNVRSIGVVSSMDDIGNIVLTQQGGVPVLVSDVAKVQIGFAPRLGLAGRDDKTDVVTGIVLMQKLERTMDVVKRVRTAVERINSDGSLPSGVKIVPFYDRGDLVAITVQTVLHNLLFGVSLIITIAAFLPLFTMQGVEGQIFGPMARTYAYALLGAVIATFTVTPVLASILLPAHVREVETLVVRHIRKFYQAVLVRAVRNYRRAAVIALVFLALCLSLSLRLGTEFLPKLEEGNLWIRAVMPPTITLEAGLETVAKIRAIIASYPPVQTVFSEQGRGDEGTDPDGSFLAEFFVPLKPADTWPSGLTKEQMVKQLSERLNREFVGVDFNFSQYIQDNIEEAVSGVKGENSIKIFGRDLNELERLSKSVKTELSGVRGVADPASFNLLGQPNLIVQIDRAKTARYGFSISDINSVVQAAIGGQEVSKVYEGEMVFALTVRLAPEYRRDVDAIRAIPVALPNPDPKTPTAYIRLGDLGEIKLVSGAAYIYRENSQRFIPLKYSVRDRDLGSTVVEAQERVQKSVPLPQGYSLEWSGEYGALVDAKKRLALIVPLSLLLILMLLYGLFNSIRDSLLALSGIPFAVAGGILGLYIGGLNFSVSAAVGFISLFGVSAMDGILLMSYIRRDIEEGLGTEDAIIRAAETRMRQIFMTGLSACIGLVPAAISTGIGSQVQQPLACVIVGGMLLSPICSLLVIPVLARLWMPTIKETGMREVAVH